MKVTSAILHFFAKASAPKSVKMLSTSIEIEGLTNSLSLCFPLQKLKENKNNDKNAMAKETLFIGKQR
ncbi:MAG: hypothetical protein MJZ91_06235 [Bacteroidales bacterium]|nr:hypothetical protein [Bacteroidales bacterium]